MKRLGRARTGNITEQPSLNLKSLLLLGICACVNTMTLTEVLENPALGQYHLRKYILTGLRLRKT